LRQPNVADDDVEKAPPDVLCAGGTVGGGLDRMSTLDELLFENVSQFGLVINQKNIQHENLLAEAVTTG
jgi:hypothetical protein